MKKITITIFICFCAFNVFAIKGYIRLSGTLAYLTDGDSVAMQTCKYGVNSFTATPLNKVHVTKVSNHSFVFLMKAAPGPLYFTLTFYLHGGKRFAVGNYFLEDGDDIRVDEINNLNYIHFSGIGAEKLNITYQLAQLNSYNVRADPEPQTRGAVPRYLEGQDRLLLDELRYLDENKNAVSHTAHFLIRANLLSQNIGKYAIIDRFNGQHKDAPLQPGDYAGYHDLITEQFHLPLFSKDPQLQYSVRFATAIVSRFRYDSCTVAGKDFDIYRCYQYLKKNFTGILRERLVTTLIYDRRNAQGDISGAANDALHYLSDKDLRPIVQKLAANRAKGVTAYDFSLADTSGILHRLSDFRGKTVVLDLWFTGCANCVRTAPILKRIEHEMSSPDIVFISICTDAQKSLWISNVKSHKYTSGYTLDLYTMGLGVQHEMISHYDIISFPTFIVINRAGAIMDNPENPLIDNGKSLERLIAQACQPTSTEVNK